MSGCQTRSRDEGLGQRVRQYRQMGSVVFSPSSLSLTGPVQMKNVCVYVCVFAGVHVCVCVVSAFLFRPSARCTSAHPHVQIFCAGGRKKGKGIKKKKVKKMAAHTYMIRQKCRAFGFSQRSSPRFQMNLSLQLECHPGSRKKLFQVSAELRIKSSLHQRRLFQKFRLLFFFSFFCCFFFFLFKAALTQSVQSPRISFLSSVHATAISAGRPGSLPPV